MRTGYRMPTRIHMGAGALNTLPSVAERHRASRCLLVFDAGLEGTPWPAQAHEALVGAGLEVVSFSDVEPNPRAATVDRAAALACEVRADLVVGLGGGSVLDAAKAVATAAPSGGGIAVYEGRNRYTAKPLPFVAIPTTCGTGSEVTWVSVITVMAERRKISVKGESMFPSDAIVDPDTLTTLPPHLVASTAMDALTHAVEATVGAAANPISDALAEVAIGLLYRYLPRAARDIEGDDVAREAVMRASTIAGMAFGNADVGGVHCLSETIGGMHDHPHGLVNAMLLPAVMRHHLNAARSHFGRLARVARHALDGDAGASIWPSGAGPAPEAFVDSLAGLAALVGIPAFGSLGIDPDEFPEIAAGAVTNGSNGSNPQPMDEEAYLSVLRSAVAG